MGEVALSMGLIPSFVVRHFPDSWEFYIPDETVYQNVHARHTYGSNNIIRNHQLVDIIHVIDERNRYVDLASFHHVVPL